MITLDALSGSLDLNDTEKYVKTRDNFLTDRVLSILTMPVISEKVTFEEKQH